MNIRAALLPCLLLLFLLLSPPGAAQDRTLRVTITSDNAYIFGFGDVNSIDPATVAGAVFNVGTATSIYGARVWDVQENGGALPPQYSGTVYGPERYTLPGDIAGKYIYIVAWSDNAVWQGTIALFEDAETGFRLATGPDSPWEVYATGWNRDAGAREYPGLSDVNARIALANSKTGRSPGSIGWVNSTGCTDGSAGCRGTLLHCTEFTEARIAGFPDLKNNFGEAQFMWYRNPDFPDGSCDVATTPAALSGEYLIFRLGPIDQIIAPRPCDSIGVRFDTIPENPCWAQVLLRNVALMPWYAVRLRILSEGITFQDFETEAGWTVHPNTAGTSVVARPPGERIPFCTDAPYFSFRLGGADTIDALIEVEWFANDMALCRDTLAWHCEQATSFVGDMPHQGASDFRILGYAPDPVRDGGTVRFVLDRALSVRIDLYSLLGQHLATVLDEDRARGTHAVGFSAAGLPSGTCLLRMSSGERTATIPVRIVK